MTLQGSPKHTVPRVLARFVSGRALDGRARTNATFLQWADRDLTKGQRASQWSKRPGWHRAAWRLGITLPSLAFAVGYFMARMLTIVCGILALVILASVAVWRTRVAILEWSHTRNLVKPLHHTAAVKIVGHPLTGDYREYITVPRNFMADDKAVITYKLPRNSWLGNPGQRRELHGLFQRRLGGDWSPTWYDADGANMRVEFRKAPSPPESVSLADIKSDLDAGSLNVLVLGYGASKSLVTIDLDSDAPHIAMSIGTGGGKSSILRLIIAYLKRHGVERIDIIDPKRVSQNWAKGIPGIYIHRTMAEQMEAIHNFRLRLESRYDALDTDDSLTFPRHVLIVEEQNSFMGYAATYWDDFRRELPAAERAKLPRKNPVIADLAYCLFQGRQACMNIISVFQRQSAAASGGGDMRDQYGAKLLARFGPQAWKILVGTTPVPRSSRINGRGYYVLGDEHHAVQFAYLREAKEKDWPGIPREQWRDEAREYALSGEPAQGQGQGQGQGQVCGNAAEPAQNGSEPQTADLADTARVSLREACEAGILPLRYATARKARQRAANGHFPMGERTAHGMLYCVADLREWHSRTYAKRS